MPPNPKFPLFVTCNMFVALHKVCRRSQHNNQCVGNIELGQTFSQHSHAALIVLEANMGASYPLTCAVTTVACQTRLQTRRRGLLADKGEDNFQLLLFAGIIVMVFGAACSDSDACAYVVMNYSNLYSDDVHIAGPKLTWCKTELTGHPCCNSI
jgi:hypothetical protein